MRHLLLAALFSVLAMGCFSNDDRVGIYESCASDPCQAGLTCYTVAFEAGRTGSMCTDQCEVTADCPFGGACFGLVGDPVEQRVCFERCDVDFDCPRNFICANAEYMGEIIDGICLPE